MNTAVFDQRETYREINGVTGPVHSVIFGAKYLSELPVAELVQHFGLNISVCNRSVETALLADAPDLLDECVFALRPRKVFLNFGDNDLGRKDFDADAFLTDYRRLIERIQACCDSQVYVISVLGEGETERRLNRRMRAMAQECGAGFVDVTDIFRHEKPRLRLFNELMHYMREGRVSFCDAMHLCKV